MEMWHPSTRAQPPIEKPTGGFPPSTIHDQIAARIRQVLCRCGGSAAAKGCAQPGRYSYVYPGLVADDDIPKPAAKKFLDQVILFVVEVAPPR